MLRQHGEVLVRTLLIAGLLPGCATLGLGGEPPAPPPPPEPPHRNRVTPRQDLRPLEQRSAPEDVVLPAESEAAAIGRGLHQALVTGLRDRGHEPATASPLPAPPLVDVPAGRAFPERLTGDLFPPDQDGLLVMGLGEFTTTRNGEGEQRGILLHFVLYRLRDGARVWTRSQRWEKQYPTPPDPADLGDDLIDALMQRAVPQADEVGPLPLLHDLPPAVPPPLPAPPPPQ
ncbi:MAG: hypothetical protein RBU45_04625 [Myxococcota bacterium]|nr:hypothetical protein [Myxococcota bacterium]